ncbi:MAG: ATP-binding protein [Thermodesulfobacteriota bacterium]
MHLATIPARMLREKPRSAYYATQKRLFAGVIILFALLPLYLINWNISTLYRESWLSKTSMELAGFAASRKELIDHFLTGQEDLLSSLVDMHDPEFLKEQANLERIFGAINRSGVMTDLGAIDSRGDHLAYSGPFASMLAGKNYRDTPWFAKVMENGRYVSDIFTGYRGVPHLIVAVTDRSRSLILRATINSEMFNSLVASANVGPEGDAFIINREGAFQTPNRTGPRSIAGAELARLRQLAAGGSAAERIGHHLYAVTPLNGGNWLLVLETDLRSSLRDFERARKFGVTLILCASLLILIVAHFVMRSLVSRIARAEDQRMLMTHRVREVEKMALVGRLAASVAHEINNPLQVISAQAGWIRELLADGPERQPANHEEHVQAAEKIREQVGRAGSITRRLLGFSRAQDGSPRKTDINQTAEDTILLLEKAAQASRIVIARDYQPDLPAVVSDGQQLQQVFLNLLNNAVDAIGCNGTITVRTRVDGARVTIEFADSGPGIPPAVLEKIFDPFFTTKEKGKGTGLGLAISRSIVDRLHGRLTAANREEGGSLFTISLPLPQPPTRESVRSDALTFAPSLTPNEP